MTAAGADAPQGPGWWLASDGKYYPPELAPAGQERGEAAAKPPAKKKIVKKKASPPKVGTAPDKQGAAKKPAAKKKVVKKKASGPRPSSPESDPASADLTDQRPGPMKFTAKAPASDQIAARRIQAKEQMAMLSEARQEAALRLLANLGEGSEPVLVGVGTRSFDARAERAAPIGGATEAPSAVEPAHESATETVARATPGPMTPPPVVSTAPPVVPRAPAQAPPPDSPPIAPERGIPAAVSPAVPVAAAAPTAPPPATPPTIGPPPKAAVAMGTDVPFMEVKGSALGTDIDRIGEKILIFADRVELHDRNHSVRQTIQYDQLSQVEVQKKIMGPSLIITSVAGATMTAKALRPELATGAKAMIEKHAERFQRGEGVAAKATEETSSEATAPAETTQATEAVAVPEAPSEPEPAASDEPASFRPPAAGNTGRTHKSVLVAMLDELHAAGILSSEEVEAKRSLIDLSDRG